MPGSANYSHPQHNTMRCERKEDDWPGIRRAHYRSTTLTGPKVFGPSSPRHQGYTGFPRVSSTEAHAVLVCPFTEAPYTPHD